VGIVVFAGTRRRGAAPDAEPQDLAAAIDSFSCRGCTAIGNGIVVSLSELFLDAGIDLNALQTGATFARSIDQGAERRPGRQEKNLCPSPQALPRRPPSSC
jgi:Ca-activated chloride channel family protein